MCNKSLALDPRRGIGRDLQLYNELTKRLNCNEKSLQKFLDRSNLTAEDFLIHFLTIAEPFAQMFQEIWDYVSSNNAVKAQESISVQFGFKYDRDKIKIDLEKFRLYAESAKKINLIVESQLWSLDAISQLFELGKILEIKIKTEPYIKYIPGKPYPLPQVNHDQHPIDTIIRRVRDLYQKIIDDYYKLETQTNNRDLSLIDETKDFQNQYLRNASTGLTDLLPRWVAIFSNIEKIPEQKKDEAYNFFKEKIEPLIRKDREEIETLIKEALDILNLPFWKHRWHTYEVWSTVCILKTLGEYEPALRIVNGRIPIDGYKEEIIADLKTTKFPEACVVAQSETPYKSATKTAIKPDLRICYDKKQLAGSTAAVVEYKQHKNMNAKYIEEISQRYTAGVPNSGGTLIVNYDTIEIDLQLSAKSKIIHPFHPGIPKNILEFKNELLNILESVEFVPVKNNRILLFDISASMQTHYKDHELQKLLPELIADNQIKIHLFNDGLVAGGDTKLSSQNFSASGGTHLGKALNELETIYGQLDYLLIVTDGEHDNPPELSRVSHIKECMPSDLSKNLHWLKK